jgi:hypothetical protein
MKEPWTVKTMLGIGDCVYAYPIIKHYTTTRTVKVLTPYPEIFSSLEIETSTDLNQHFDVKPCYTQSRSSKKGQYEDMLDSVKLQFIPFVFGWDSGFSDEFRSKHLKEIVARLSMEGKGICIVKEPCLANMHQKNGDTSVVPDIEEMQSWINENKKRFVYISVGKGEIFTHRLQGIDMDLNDQLSISDLVTLCGMAQGIATQVGHLVPIAQGLNRPLKIFYPKHIKDHRLKNIGPHKMFIPGVCNETI